MKRMLHTLMILFFAFAAFFAAPNTVLASEGDDSHGMEVEVNGYHVTLASQNEWVKGENAVMVTIIDAMGMPVSDAEVEILIAPKAESHADVSSDSHGAPETDAHAEPAADAHGSEASSHDSMSDMDVHEEESSDTMAHDEETVSPLAMTESHEHGAYVVETRIESSGEYNVKVFFHVNGEMMQADFTVEVPGMASKTVVLWSFLVINIGLVVSAGVLKKQNITLKGK
jgi:hypothetical protein